MEKNTVESSFDLIGIVLLLWKKKIILISTVIVCMTAVGIYYTTRPLSYAATATVKIGKVAHIKIESYPDIMIYLNSQIASRSDDGAVLYAAVSKLNMYSPDELYGTLLLDVSAESGDARKSSAALDAFIKVLIDRHKILFDDALKNLRKNGPNLYSEHGPLLFIDSYTFPTQLDGKIVQTVRKNGIRGGMDGVSGLMIYLFIAGMVSFIISSAVITAYDLFRSELSRRKES